MMFNTHGRCKETCTRTASRHPRSPYKVCTRNGRHFRDRSCFCTLVSLARQGDFCHNGNTARNGSSTTDAALAGSFRHGAPLGSRYLERVYPNAGGWSECQPHIHAMVFPWTGFLWVHRKEGTLRASQKLKTFPCL